MICAIAAYEGTYQGYHGIITRFVDEFSSYEEAVEAAIEESYNVMYDSFQVYKIFEQELADYIEDTDERDEMRIEEMRDEIYENNLAFDIYYLDKTKIENKTLKQLDEEFYQDPEGFLEKYEAEEF